MSIPDEIVEKALIRWFEDSEWSQQTSLARYAKNIRCEMRAALTAVLPDLTAAAVAAARKEIEDIAATRSVQNYEAKPFTSYIEGRADAFDYIARIIRARSNTP